MIARLKLDRGDLDLRLTLQDLAFSPIESVANICLNYVKHLAKLVDCHRL
jgi:hypothetical protein